MRKLFLCSLAALALVFAGCNGSSKPITITITSPTGAQALDLGQSFTISVQVSNDKTNKGVTFNLTGIGALSNQSSTAATYTAPATGTGGTASITIISATDSTKTATIMVTVTPPPSISNSSPTLPGAIQGTAYNATITTSGGAGSLNYSVTVGNLPPGLSLNSSSGAISGTPTSTGTFTFTVQVKDSSTVSPQISTKQFTITVNEQPTITSANTATFVAGTAGTFQVTVTSIPNSAIAETGSLPAGITFTDNGNNTATLAGTTSTTGTFPITINANNGVGTAASQNFSLVVGKAPTISSGAATTFTVGTAGTFSVTTTGYPAPSLSESGGLPSGVTLTDNKNGTATLAGTPAANSGGKYTFTITANNGIGTNATQSFTLTVDQAPAISSANSTNFTINVAGTSFSVTSTGYPTPALSETGALPAGISFHDNGNGTAIINGTPTVSGAFPISITATNGIGSNATQAFTINVNQPPAITSGAAITFSVGSAGTFSVTTTGFPAPGLSESGTLPGGVTFTDNKNGTATLAGTPSTGTGGKYPLMITASNGVGTNATQSFTLTVDQAPAITSANAATFSVSAAGSFSVTTSGYPAPALSETGALPSGVTFHDNGNGSATLSGTPAGGTAGSYPITITANNGVSPNATQSFTLTVNTAPAFTSAAATTFTVGSAGTFTITATGSPTPSFTESGALPSGVTFHDNGNGSATLAGTPATGTGKIYSLTITASNTAGSTNQTFALTVDQAPAITSANSTTFTVGTSASFTIMSTGVPAPALSESGALPSGVTFVDNGNATATLSGTPASGTAGSYPITITANNGVSPNATQSFTLTVNTAPVFSSSASTTFTVGAAGTFTVTASGSPTFTESGALPSGVTFVDNHNGTATLAGTPAVTTGGVYNFTIKATNATGSSQQSFTLTVDEAPSFTSKNSAAFALGQASTFNVAAAGYPAPTISESGALPSGVSFNSTSNTLSGTPATGTAGTYPISFTASNGVTPNATQSFTLTVVSSACGGSGTGSESLLNGQYAFLLKGFDNGTGTGETQPEPVLVGGVLTFNGSNNNGQITAGTIDMNTYSSAGISTQTVTGGTYTVGSDHRACLSITTAQGTQTYRASLGSISGGVASLAHMIDFDASGPFTDGVMKKQTTSAFSTSQVTGNYAFAVSSLQNSVVGGGKFGAVGYFKFSSGNVTAGEVDFNELGQLNGGGTASSFPSPVAISSGSYTISSTTGRGTLNFTPSGDTSLPAILYVISSTDLFVVSNISQTDTNNSIWAGELLQQSGAPFSANPLSGSYAGYDSGLGDNGSGSGRTDIFLLGPLTSGSTSLPYTQQRNDSGAFTSGSTTGSYSVDSNGRVTITGTGNHNPIAYLVSTSQGFILNSNGGVDSGFFQLQSGGPFTNSSLNGTYAYGSFDPEYSGTGVNSGVAVFTSATTSVNITEDSNSNGSQTVGGTQSFTYSINSSGLLQIPTSGSNCTVSASSTTCQTLIYLVSPTKALILDTQASSPKTQEADQ